MEQFDIKVEGETIGKFSIYKKRENGSWGIDIKINDINKLPEDTDFQRKTGNLSTRLEVKAIEEIIQKVFKEDEVFSIYTIVPSSCPALIRIIKAVNFNEKGWLLTRDGQLVILERLKK